MSEKKVKETKKATPVAQAVAEPTGPRVNDLPGEGILLMNPVTKRRYAVSLVPGDAPDSFNVVINWGSFKKFSKKTKPEAIQGRDAARALLSELIEEKIATDDRWEVVPQS